MSVEEAHLKEVYPVVAGDFTAAGAASATIKRMLRQLGVDASVLRRVAVASYEVELNLIIHSLGGTLTLEVDEHWVRLCSQDVGPGIPDVELAMREGYSTATEEVRSLGFGAGMGLPNMRRNADEFEITSAMGEGTCICMGFRFS